MKKIIGILLVFMMAFTIITINPFKVKAASTTTSAQVKDLISGNSLTAGSSGTNNNIKLTAGSELDKGGTNQWTSYTISTDVSGALITKVSIQGTEMVSTTGWTYTSGAAVWEDVNGATSVSGPSMKVTGNSLISVTYVSGKANISAPTTITKTYDGSALVGTATSTTSGASISYQTKTSTTGEYSTASESTPSITYVGTLYVKATVSAEGYANDSVEYALTINKITTPIIITVDKNSKTYDGTKLDSSCTYTQGVLLTGDELEIELSTTNITDAGKETVSVSSFEVWRSGTKVTNCYTFGTSVSGYVEVTKRSVIITSTDESKTYDGTALTGDYSITGDGFVLGEAEVSVTGSQTNYGSSKNTISITGKGNYDEDNYDITTDEGTLTVTKRSVIISSSDESKTYDGTALTGDYSITGDGFVSGEVDVSVTGSQTNFGSSKNTISITGKGNYDEDNYDITTDEGTLTVNKRYVTLIAPTQYKVFDGKELTNKNYTMVGSFAKGEGADVNIEGAITMVGEVDNVLTYQLHENTDPNNYVITTINGTLGVEYDQVQVQIKLGGNMLSDIIHQVAQYLDKESNNVILTGVSYDAGAGEYVPVENIPLIKFIPGMNGDAFGITINFQFTYSDGTVSYVRARLQFIY